MVLVTTRSTGGSLDITSIIENVRNKEELYRAVGYLALRKAVENGDYRTAWEIIRKYSRYIPEFRKILGYHDTLFNTYMMIQGYMNTLLECVQRGDVDCVSRIYNEELQSIIPPAVEVTRKLGLDVKPLEGIEWLTYGLLYAAKLIHDINNILVNTPRINGDTPEQLSEQFMRRARFYSEAVERIRSIIDGYKPMIVNAVNHLRSLGLGYYRILDNILAGTGELEKQLVAMEDIDVSLSKAFRGVAELENALWVLEHYGFDTAKPYLVKGLLDLAGAIKELRAKANEYVNTDIAEANGSRTSIGELANRYAEYFMHLLKNTVDSLAKTGDPRIIDVLRENTLGLVNVPEGYEEKPVLKNIAEAVHYIIDANKRLFHKVQNMLLEGNIWAKPLLGLATLGVVGSSLIDAFTMLLRPDELRQQLVFLINGLKTLATNPEGWVKGSWSIVREMFSSPYNAVYTLSTLVALPLATEGLAELLSRKTQLLRTVGDILQGDPLGTTVRLLKIIRSTPKARLLVRRLGVDDKIEALLIGRGTGEQLRRIISTEELDDMITQYIMKNYRELAETLGDELRRIRATSIPEYLRILREIVEKKQRELLHYITSRSQLQRTISQEIRALIREPVEIALNNRAVRRILGRIQENLVPDYREAVVSLERVRSSLKQYIESLEKLGIDTRELHALVEHIDRAIGDIVSSATSIRDTLNILRNSITTYLEEAGHPVTIDDLRRELVETITRVDNRLNTIITRIKQLEKELPPELRDDAAELYNALRVLRDKIASMMKDAETDPVGTILDIDRIIRNVFNQYKTVIDRIDVLSMHLRRDILRDLEKTTSKKAVLIKKAIDEGVIPQLLRLREIALQLGDEATARQIEGIAHEIQSSPIHMVADTIDKAMPRIEDILSRLEERISTGEKLVTNTDRILHAINTIKEIGDRLRKIIRGSPLLETLEKYIDSFTVRAKNILGVAVVNIEPTIMSGLLQGLLDGLEYIRRLSPEMYDELKPYIDVLVEDLRRGTILERDVRAVERIANVFSSKPVVPYNMYRSLTRILETVRPVSRHVEKILSTALAELKRIYPLKGKAVFILGSIDEAEAKKIPLIMADPDYVSMVRHMFTGKYEFRSNGYTIIAMAQWERTVLG